MVTTIVWLIIGAAFSAALPIGLLLWWRRTRQARLLPFFVGALIWFVFAGTLEQLLHSAVLLGDNALARAITGNPYLYMVYGGLAAGLFEETGRYVAFRWLINKRRYPERDTAVTYGIGHGGIEAMLTLGATYATMIVVAFYLRHGNQSAALATMGGSAEALSTYTAALGQLTTGTVLLAMAERAGAMILHLALSLFVFLAARDRLAVPRPAVASYNFTCGYHITFHPFPASRSFCPKGAVGGGTPTLPREGDTDCDWL